MTVEQRKDETMPRETDKAKEPEQLHILVSLTQPKPSEESATFRSTEGLFVTILLHHKTIWFVGSLVIQGSGDSKNPLGMSSRVLGVFVATLAMKIVCDDICNLCIVH